MKIVEPSASLMSWTRHDLLQAEQHIERCGRVCYKSEDKITADSAGKFIRMLIEREHESVLEHASATILFVCDRGVSHELVRHRLASYSQESTRYCNYSKDKHGGEITVIRPPGMTLGRTTEGWELACRTSEGIYLGMLKDKISPQIARSVLPTCLKTEIAVTANLREWKHILKLRTSKAAHPQIREIMLMAGEKLKEIAPNVFFDRETE